MVYTKYFSALRVKGIDKICFCCSTERYVHTFCEMFFFQKKVNHVIFCDQVICASPITTQFFKRRERFYTSESDVCGRQNLTYKDGPRIEKN